MKKFIAATVTAATLVLAPVAVFADSIADIKALAEKDGLKVTETSTQIIITKPKTTPTTPSTPTTPTTPSTTTQPKDDTKTENADFRLAVDPIERSIGKDKVVQSKIDIDAVYGSKPIKITDKVVWEIPKGTPISVDKNGIITATKNGEYPVTISYNGKYMDLKLKVTGYQLKNGKHSAYVTLNGGSATKTR
ncbi:hypothetical protein DFP93_101250 [Aneurinibacillus soli]|uniref:Uncharacterized protein n=1 Tax=Aneurinibacillus soli TaxID=1500254 RepID=A0A0U5BBT0_9BACL|nr:hypothetical protein [Aneurinibacillus soli]PYE64224.1 hypothetical protein DFP93_101250 [Aneurinibacillus soli]BAU28173.1 hypothetical protein CB4_02347 [Aneurinibacillus soli]